MLRDNLHNLQEIQFKNETLVQIFLKPRLLVIIAISMVVEGELANKTINYHTEIKEFQFEPEV